MTVDILLVFLVLAGTIILFVSEWLRVDVIAILIMVTLAWLGLVKPEEAFSGLASNAVVCIIAVMILGYGVDRSGVMNRITRPILRAAGFSERRLTGLVSVAIGFLSAFIQNIGAAALFLPAILRISKSSKIPASHLLMPMGFAAILGGTLSMVGSSPLLILNDLLKQGGEETFGLFSVTPLGLVLLGTGIVYFLFFGRFVLPAAKGKADSSISAQDRLIDTWQLPSTVYQVFVPPGSTLVGKTRDEIKIRLRYGLNVLALLEGEDVRYAPWRHMPFRSGQEIALLGQLGDVERFVDDFDLQVRGFAYRFRELQSGETAGFAEVIIPPRSPVVGKSLRQIEVRKTWGVEPIMTLIGDKEERHDLSDQELQPGEAILVHGPWGHIRKMADNVHFVLVTPVEAPEATGKRQPLVAALCFLAAIWLALSGVPLPVGLLSGALAMILLGVVPIDEAYRAVDWRTVFLLAGLMPLGIAMGNTGAAEYIARQMMLVLQGSHPIWILLCVAVLSTLFSLFMSNAAATVLLVPLVMIMGNMSDINPRALALLVAVCASNSFVLPTHQVNALFMSPGGYRSADYLRAGGIMTLLFIGIAVGFVYLTYL
ncbi:MAG: SLC13 family permease [Candidatus Eisenbacteria sp.]|nr:SLC13 family permease [Candidatus Eisenbacteria bacterium]